MAATRRREGNHIYLGEIRLEEDFIPYIIFNFLTYPKSKHLKKKKSNCQNCTLS